MVDKYITDAVMAFFGAPVPHEDDALRSVMAGIEMTESLRESTRGGQVLDGKEPFNVSVGINRGRVTVGTIGTEDKMNYTVIGDAVNLASRLSGLTRLYQPGLLFSEQDASLRKDNGPVPAAGLGGREGPQERREDLYGAPPNLAKAEMEGWGLHNLGMAEYYERNFSTAAGYFRDALKVMPGDLVSTMLLERSPEIRQGSPARWMGRRGGNDPQMTIL